MTSWNGRFNPETALKSLDPPFPASGFNIMFGKDLYSFQRRSSYFTTVELGKLLAY